MSPVAHLQKFQNTDSSILASLNAQSLLSKHSNLQLLISELSSIPLHILAIQETWAIPHPHLVSIPGFNFTHLERKIGRGGGVGFYVRDDLIFRQLPNFSTFIPKIFECLTIEVSIDNRKSTFSTIYRSPSDNSESLNEFITHLDQLLFELTSSYQNSYICLDSNINSLIQNPSPLHAKYFSTIFENGFIQVINKATRITHNSSSLIDHILTNSSLSEFTSGTIITDVSDHFLTFLQLPSCQPRNQSKTVKSRNFSKANLDRFRECLGNLSWRNVLNSNDVDDSYNLFWDDFSLLFEQNFPTKSVKFNKNLHKIYNYMTPGLLVSRQTKIKLHKASIHNPSNENVSCYKKFRNIYNKVMRASKKMYFDNNLKNAKQNPKKTWQLLKEAIGSTGNNSKINELIVNSEKIVDTTKMANCFNEFFSNAGKKIAQALPNSPIPPENYFIPNNTDNLCLGTISPGEICDIIKASKSKVSTDIDGISMKLLKAVQIEISTPLAHIFNLSLKNGVFPSSLKSSKIIPLLKSGSPSSCDNYRPIALVSTFSKILEKFVSIKLTNHLEINKLIHPNQFGFQRNKNTEQNLLNVINFISKALNDGDYCVGVFLDLRKAFDTVNHSILFKKLEHLGVRGVALKWFVSYLSGRTQCVSLDGILSNPQEIDISVLQGTILGPILFLCFINDLPNSSKLLTYLFADDTQGLASGKNLPELIDRVNTELKKWASWFISNKMSVNVSKTKYIIFHTVGKKIPPSLNQVVFDCNIPNTPHDSSLVHSLDRIHNKHPSPESQAYKLLGVYFDENLSFDKNTNFLIAKMSKSIYCINRAKHFLPQSALLTLYHSLIHSHLLYCPLIYSCTNKTNLEKIFRTQKKALRIVTNSKFHDHTAPLFSKHKILSLEKIILQAKLHFMHSINYNYAPPTFQLLWQKNTARNLNNELRNQNDFTMPRANSNFFTKFPLFTFPKEWNNAGIVTHYSNLTTFKIALTEELLNNNNNTENLTPTVLPPSLPLLTHLTVDQFN